MSQSEQINELVKALVAVQAVIKDATKDSTNPFFQSRYADLGSVLDACREPLAKNGLAVIQTMGCDSNGVYVETMLCHISGQYKSGILHVNAKNKDPQGYGSAITYARRYSLAAIVGITQVDDDAEAAMGPRAPHKNNPVKPKQKTEEQKSNDAIYYIPFGKFKGQMLETVGAIELRNYVNWLESMAKDQNKEITGDVADFIKRVEVFVGLFENQDVPQ